jgi:L,D-transpeptidase YcbB
MRSQIFLIVLALMVGCQRQPTTLVREWKAPAQHDVQQPIQIPNDSSQHVYENLRYSAEIFSFYKGRRFKPFWLDNNTRSALADSMIMMINSSRRFGLLPQRYHFQEVPELMLEPMNHLKMSRLDIVLTDAFLTLMRDLRRGRLTSNQYGSNVDAGQLMFLSESLKPSDLRRVMSSQEPRHQAYWSLKNALSNILDTVNRTDHNLLMHGITFDSVEVHRKIQRIEINLERWRQEKEMADSIYVWVNVPAYMFYLLERGNVVIESRVIVGAYDTPTPVFSSKIECFTIFPYWYVPRKITVNEYLPIIKKDSSFITRNNFDVLDHSGKIQNLSSIEWKKYNKNNFPFILRQREGTENSLGIVKFIFDNPYAVFLHDTNAKRLFKNKKRALSHGCIRLEKAYEFSHYLIGGNRTKLSPKTLDKYMGEKKRVTISLSHPVPIHIRYLTCDVKNNELVFFDDVYKKDDSLINSLYRQDVTSLERANKDELKSIVNH